MAQLLHAKGYRDVRPLLGGFEGWLSLGYPIEPIGLVSVPVGLLADAGRAG